MPSRFGLKDLVIIALALAAGAASILNLVQQDRLWARTRQLAADAEAHARTLTEVSERLAALEARPAPPTAEDFAALRQQVERLRAQPAPAGDAAPPRSAGTPSDTSADDDAADWFAGVPVTRPAPWTPAHDPRQHPAFAPGGTLTEALEGAVSKLTPYLATDAYSFRVINDAVCQSLAAYDMATLEPRAQLADAWQVDPAGLWLRVRIRPGARWSDGAPVTADDIRFTFRDFVQNPRINAAAHRASFAAVREVRVVSERVAEFRFDTPLFSSLSVALFNPIIPRHFYEPISPESLNASTGLLMGSGPWKLAPQEGQWAPPAPILLVRNEHFAGPVPPLERLRFTVVPDAGTRLAELEQNRADLIRATPEQIVAARAGQGPAATPLVWTNMRSGYTFIAWNTGERRGRASPFADVRVRRAMTHLLDRERMNRDFYRGLASVSTGPFPPTQADPDLKPIPFDLQRAAALLDECGWSDRNADGVREDAQGSPFEFEFAYTPGGVMGEPLALYLKDQAAKVGIRVTPRAVDFTTLTQMRRSRDFDAFYLQLSWSGPESDPFSYFHQSQADAGENWTGWRSPETSALIDRARSTIDPAARAPLWREVHRAIAEQQPFTFLLDVPWLRLVSPRVHNVHSYPGTLDRREFFIPLAQQ
ncbi:MAG: ABC transporter substrate-binding protein [Planctomycetota bacterium]|nr:ABC transporter substrate-binding protein [Planctomycetota bacterium]